MSDTSNYFSEILTRHFQVLEKKESPSESQTGIFFDILCFTFWLLIINFTWIINVPEYIFDLWTYFLPRHYILPEHNAFYLSICFSWTYRLPEYIFHLDIWAHNFTCSYINVYFTWTYILVTWILPLKNNHRTPVCFFFFFKRSYDFLESWKIFNNKSELYY